jgi:ABC-type polysaccharide/polyol phosphate export permease
VKVNHPQPNVVYDSAHRGSLALEELRAIFKYRDLVVQLVRRDLVSRYKRSVFGVIWTLLNPLGTMLILTLVFSGLFQSVEGYPIYVLSGLVAWNFFAQTTAATLNQNVWGSALLHRIYLPRTAFSIAALGVGLFNLLLSVALLIFISLATSFPLKITVLFLPLPVALLALFSLGLGLLFSTLAIYFPDVVEMFQVALTAWMYLTPIFYPPEIIPPEISKWMFGLNPMYTLVELIRQPVYDGLIPHINLIASGSAISLVTLIIGWLVFTWKANDLTYRT